MSELLVESLEFIREKSSGASKDEFLENHGLHGLFYKYLGETQYRYRYEKTRNLNIILLDCFANIDSELQSEGLASRPIKGVHLVRDLYLDPGVRPMTDIDLWVEDLDSAGRVLQRMGFSESESGIWDANSHKKTFHSFWHDTPVTIELHDRLFSGQDPSPVAELESERYLLYLMSHLCHQHTFLKLFWLIDILYFYDSNEIDFHVVEKMARENRRVQSLRMCLTALWLISREKLGDNLVKGLSSSFLMSPKKNLPQYFLMKHLTKDSWQEAFSYNWGWLTQKVRG